MAYYPRLARKTLNDKNVFFLFDKEKWSIRFFIDVFDCFQETIFCENIDKKDFTALLSWNNFTDVIFYENCNKFRLPDSIFYIISMKKNLLRKVSKSSLWMRPPFFLFWMTKNCFKDSILLILSISPILEWVCSTWALIPFQQSLISNYWYFFESISLFLNVVRVLMGVCLCVICQ